MSAYPSYNVRDSASSFTSTAMSSHFQSFGRSYIASNKSNNCSLSTSPLSNSTPPDSASARYDIWHPHHALQPTLPRRRRTEATHYPASKRSLGSYSSRKLSGYALLRPLRKADNRTPPLAYGESAALDRAWIPYDSNFSPQPTPLQSAMSTASTATLRSGSNAESASTLYTSDPDLVEKKAREMTDYSDTHDWSRDAGPRKVPSASDAAITSEVTNPRPKTTPPKLPARFTTRTPSVPVPSPSSPAHDQGPPTSRTMQVALQSIHPPWLTKGHPEYKAQVSTWTDWFREYMQNIDAGTPGKAMATVTAKFVGTRPHEPPAITAPPTARFLPPARDSSPPTGYTEVCAFAQARRETDPRTKKARDHLWCIAYESGTRPTKHGRLLPEYTVLRLRLSPDGRPAAFRLERLMAYEPFPADEFGHQLRLVDLKRKRLGWLSRDQVKVLERMASQTHESSYGAWFKRLYCTAKAGGLLKLECTEEQDLLAGPNRHR